MVSPLFELKPGWTPPRFEWMPGERTWTLGPVVADLCARADYAPDPGQELVLNYAFAFNPERTKVAWDIMRRRDEKAKLQHALMMEAFELGLVGPRQQLKTGSLIQMDLGWMFITREREVMWTAHLFDTAKGSYNNLVSIIANHSFLSRHLERGPANGLYSSPADMRIQLREDGGVAPKTKFRARGDAQGRGLTGDKVILDEAFKLSATTLGALLPTLTSRPRAQVIYASSAGMADSDALRDIRDRGRAGAVEPTAGSHKLAYLEWSAPRRDCKDPACKHLAPGKPGHKPGCAMDDRELWHIGNPLLGRTRADGSGFSLDKMEGFRESMPPSEFGREFLGWWDEPGMAAVFPAGTWQACAINPEDPLPLPGALGVAASVDHKHAAIVGAVKLEDGTKVWKSLAWGPGTNWVVSRVKELAAELQQDYAMPVILDGAGPAAFLAPYLTDSDAVDLHLVNWSQYSAACATVFQEVADKRLAHLDQPELNDAVAAATRREVGDRWAWGRRGEGVDISTLEAGTLADWGVDSAAPAPSVYESEDVQFF